jgi:hypothetical protein
MMLLAGKNGAGDLYNGVNTVLQLKHLAVFAILGILSFLPHFVHGITVLAWKHTGADSFGAAATTSFTVCACGTLSAAATVAATISSSLACATALDLAAFSDRSASASKKAW